MTHYNSVITQLALYVCSSSLVLGTLLLELRDQRSPQWGVVISCVLSRPPDQDQLPQLAVVLLINCYVEHSSSLCSADFNDVGVL